MLEEDRELEDETADEDEDELDEKMGQGWPMGTEIMVPLGPLQS